MDEGTSLTPIHLPELGTGGERIRVSTWLVDLEESVELGERLVDVLIPGVSFSVTSPIGGRVVKIACPTDSLVSPGDILGWLEPKPGAN